MIRSSNILWWSPEECYQHRIEQGHSGDLNKMEKKKDEKRERNEFVGFLKKRFNVGLNAKGK